MQQVDSEDAAFLFLEQHDNPAHLGLIALYDQSEIDEHVIRFQHILKHIRNRLNSAPVFHQKIKRVPADLDYPYWVEDEKFDLEYHVRHMALPKPGDWRQFCIQISRIHSRPLDIRRPLWELYVIEGLDDVAGLPKGSFALYFKIHHCAMDEFTALELLESLHETTPSTDQHEQGTTQVTRFVARNPEPVDIAVKMVLGNIGRGVKFTAQSFIYRKNISRQLAKLTIRGVRRAISQKSEEEDSTRFTSSPGPARVFEGGFYQRSVLTDFISLVPGANLDHALAVICGEATRCYLETKDGIENVNLTARLQINLRNAGAHALSGNRMALQNLELYTDISSLVERLYAIVGSNISASDNELEERSLSLRAFYAYIPAPMLSLLGRWSNRELQSLEAGGSCGISTLEGPGQTVYFLGAKLKGLTSVSPLYKGCGLMYSASMYGEEISIAFTSGREILPDPENLVACLDEVMERVACLNA